jgi:hypothetical protein
MGRRAAPPNRLPVADHLARCPQPVAAEADAMAVGDAQGRPHPVTALSEPI